MSARSVPPTIMAMRPPVHLDGTLGVTGAGGPPGSEAWSASAITPRGHDRIGPRCDAEAARHMAYRVQYNFHALSTDARAYAVSADALASPQTESRTGARGAVPSSTFPYSRPN